MSDEEDRYEEGEEVEETEEKNTEEQEEREEQEEVAPPVVEEDLPDEKPFDGEAKIRMPNGKDCTVRFNDKGLPAWLSYLVADDYFYFNRTIFGPDTPAAAPAAGEGEEGDEAAAEPPAEDEGEEGEGPNFDANTKFELELVDEEDLIYNATVYVPPAPAAEETGEEGADPAAATSQKEENEEGEDEEGEEPTKAQETTATEDDAAAVVEAEEVEVVTVDALTLAAIFSADALDVCLGQTELNTQVFVDFCAQTVTHKSVIIDNLVAAQAKAHEKTKKGQKNRRVKLDFSWIWQRQTSGDADMLPTTRSYVQRLIEADIVPTKAFPTTLLTTAPSVRSYVYLLWQMPKTLLQSFSAAVPTEDEPAPEDDESGPKPITAFHSQLLLDVRRRMARKKAAKKDLRNAPKETQAAFFPAAGFENKLDTLVATSYAARGYEPKALELYNSDLALVMLGMAPAEFTKDSFAKLLAAKLDIARAHDTNSGLRHLLLHSLGEVTEVAAKLIIDSISPSVFRPKGAVDAVQFVTLVIDEYFSYSAQFAKKFWVPFTENKEALAIIEKNNSKLFAEMKECEKNYTIMMHSVSENKITVSEFQKYEKDLLNEATTCNPVVLNAAIAARNKEIILYLIRDKHITTVQAHGVDGEVISVLQKVILTNDVELVDYLATEGGLLLNQTFDNGRFSALTYLEDNWRKEVADKEDSADATEENEAFKAVLARFKEVEHDRATDPDHKYGMLRSVPIQA